MAFQQAVKLDPDLAEAHFRLGLGYEALEKREDAEAQYKKAVEAYKKYPGSHENDAGSALQPRPNVCEPGKLQRSHSRVSRQATKLKTDDPDIFYDLGVAHTKLAQYDQAAAAFSKSLEIDPDYYRAQDGLDEAKEGIKRIRAGKKHQEDLLKNRRKTS